MRRNECSITWTPPLKEWLKCETGIAWDKNIKANSVSWILRNEEGEVETNHQQKVMGGYGLLKAWQVLDSRRLFLG